MKRVIDPDTRTEYKYYLRTGGTWARPYIPGEDMAGVSVSEPDKILLAGGETGGFIGTHLEDPTDKFYINPTWFAENYKESQ